MIVDFHCECPDCEAITVFERDMRYPGDRPQIHIPFSVADNSWKCGNCGIVWHVECELVNMTAETDDADLEGDMPVIEGSAHTGGRVRVRAGTGGGLTMG